MHEALTHRSRAAEDGVLGADNERLEFLGDAVLGLLISELLMAADPQAREGALSRSRAGIVNEAVLAERARSLGLDALVRLGRGERLSGGGDKASILANAFEAVLGALYLDAGLERARAFVAAEFAEAVATRAAREPDPKSSLQERLHALGLAPPRYAVRAESGPPHARSFEVEVHVAETLRGVGSGRSKQAAEQAAAREALRALDEGAP